MEVVGEIPWKQFFDAVDWMFGDADQYLAEIGFRVQSIQLGGAHQRVNGGSAFAIRVRAAEKIILPFMQIFA